MNNPYTLTFGKSPEQLIKQISKTNEIVEAFECNPPSNQVYMITGVRGSGKTVFLTEIERILKDKPDWITIELNPERDMLNSLASKLCSETTLSNLFKNARINLSFLGFEPPITDIEIAISKMLTTLDKNNKKVLITIDEITNNEFVREFIHSFQILLRNDHNVFLLMTGLYDNIYNLQNEQSLTFLYRTPRIQMEPLNIGAITDNYQRNLSISYDDALEMAKLTKGYPFAFQALGYNTFINHGNYKQSLTITRQYLEEYVYEKIWSELSDTDMTVIKEIAINPSQKIIDIRNFLNMDTNHFNPYRARLIRKGLVDGSKYGYLTLTLPFFDRFILDRFL